MNERIKELYNKVGGNDKLAIDSYLAEKFAVLIIKECADWIDGQDVSRCPWSRDLIRHFGVEEKNT